MLPSFRTDRLEIRDLLDHDAEFILELLNTEGWLRFIGDRQVKTEADALAFIDKTRAKPGVWVGCICLLENKRPIGIMSYIKRDFLPHFDLGFALLPGFQKMGYAYEASSASLAKIKEVCGHRTILANILPENQTSIRLVEKLGFVYSHPLEIEHEMLSIYIFEEKKC